MKHEWLESYLYERLKELEHEKSLYSESTMTGGKNLHRVRGCIKEIKNLIKLL